MSEKIHRISEGIQAVQRVFARPVAFLCLHPFQSFHISFAKSC
jgi:hypothetical protein